MDLVALNPRERAPRVRWNAELRIFLCCLHKFFERDTRVFTDIFNLRFRDELTAFGFSNRVSDSTITSQWDTMKRQNDLIWGIVHISEFDFNGRWSSVIAEIRATASILELTVTEKTQDDIDTSSFAFRPPSQPQSTMPCTPPPSSQPPVSEAPISEPPIYTPDSYTPDSLMSSSIEPPSSLCTNGDKVCFWCHKEGFDLMLSPFNASKEYIPPLLYRWYNIESQGVNSKDRFVAGFFSEATGYFPPDYIGEQEFNKHFLNHIRSNETLTPFISTFTSMLAPVHRAIREGEGASISIIDARKILTPVYSAKHFVREHNVKIGRYRGFGEYLIWGKLDSPAIICSFKLTSLLKVVAENPEISDLLQLDGISMHKKARKGLHRVLESNAPGLTTEAGNIVGKLLSSLQVPAQYSKDISMGMAYSWRLKRTEGSWDEYLAGVEAGYGRQSLPPPIVGGELAVLQNIEEDEDDDDYEAESDDGSDDEDTMSLDETHPPLDDDSSSTIIDSPSPTQQPEEVGQISTTEVAGGCHSKENEAANPVDQGHEGHITLVSSDDEEHHESDASSEVEIFQDFIPGARADRFTTERARVRFFLN